MDSQSTTQIVSVLSIFLILIVVAIIALISFLVYLHFKEKREKGTDKNENVSSNEKNTKAQNKQSIFNFMEFDTVRDNMIIQKNGNRYLMVVECQGINYDLMSGVEKTSVEEGFVQFLNTLRHPVQIYIQTRSINLESSLSVYREKVKAVEMKLTNMQMQYEQMRESGEYSEEQLRRAFFEVTKQANLYEYGKSVLQDTERMSLNKNILNKKYYLVIPYYSAEAANDNLDKAELEGIAFSELYTRARSIMRTLSRCEVNSKILDSKGLVELLYNAYNREDSDIFSAQTAINAGFDSLYSTAPDVIDKKMKLINKQIEENGTKLANEAVMEAKSDKEMMLRIREENAKNLIFDFAEQLISENEEYLGKDISEDAKVKVRRKKKEATEGGNENETNEKTKATRGRRPSSGNE